MAKLTEIPALERYKQLVDAEVAAITPEHIEQRLTEIHERLGNEATGQIVEQ